MPRRTPTIEELAPTHDCPWCGLDNFGASLPEATRESCRQTCRELRAVELAVAAWHRTLNRARCPGEAEYGHGATLAIVHVAGCCDRWDAASPTVRLATRQIREASTVAERIRDNLRRAIGVACPAPTVDLYPSKPAI